MAFAFALGLGTFFSPCAMALVPSYGLYFLGSEGAAGWRAGLRFGVMAALGVVGLFLIAASVLFTARFVWSIESVQLNLGAVWIGVGVGALFVVLGGLMALGRAPSWSPRLAVVLQRNARGMVLWGVLFGLGSLGCSLPLALAVVGLALNAGAGGFAILAAYAAGLAGLVLIAGVVLGVFGPAIAKHGARWARPIQIGMGVLLALAGAYVMGYYLLQV